MAGTQPAEVAAVQRDELGLAQTLDDGQDRSVDEADIGVGVALDNFVNAVVVLSYEVLDLEGARDYASRILG